MIQLSLCAILLATVAFNSCSSVGVIQVSDAKPSCGQTDQGELGVFFSDNEVPNHVVKVCEVNCYAARYPWESEMRKKALTISLKSMQGQCNPDALILYYESDQKLRISGLVLEDESKCDDFKMRLKDSYPIIACNDKGGNFYNGKCEIKNETDSPRKRVGV